MHIKIGTTGRGWAIAEFADRYGAACSIQKSSLATENAIWLGVDDADPKIMARDAAAHGVATEETVGWVPFPIPQAVQLRTRMHLTQEQVAELLPILQHFAETGELPEKAPCAVGDDCEECRDEKDSQAAAVDAAETLLRHKIGAALYEKFEGVRFTPENIETVKAQMVQVIAAVIQEVVPPHIPMPEVSIEFDKDTCGLNIEISAPPRPVTLEFKV